MDLSRCTCKFTHLRESTFVGQHRIQGRSTPDVDLHLSSGLKRFVLFQGRMMECAWRASFLFSCSEGLAQLWPHFGQAVRRRSSL